MAYVLGFFLADGTFDITPRGGHYFGFHICDKHLLYDLRKALGSNHKISERVVKAGESPRYRLQIGNKKICEDLTGLGVLPQKTKQILIPAIPPLYFFDFVRGYFDGDGNVWVGYINKKRITPTLVLQVAFTSGNKDFLVNLKGLLNKYGVNGGTLYVPKTKNFARLSFSTLSGQCLAERMYAGRSELYLHRKKKQFEDFTKIYKH